MKLFKHLKNKIIFPSIADRTLGSRFRVNFVFGCHSRRLLLWSVDLLCSFERFFEVLVGVDVLEAVNQGCTRWLAKGIEGITTEGKRGNFNHVTGGPWGLIFSRSEFVTKKFPSTLQSLLAHRWSSNLESANLERGNLLRVTFVSTLQLYFYFHYQPTNSLFHRGLIQSVWRENWEVPITKQ